MKQITKQGLIGGALMAVVAGLLLLISSARADNKPDALYKAKCAVCHAPDGSGNTAMGKKLGAHDFRSESVQKMSDTELSEIVAKGKNKMPAYEKTLKPEEIKDLVSYIRELTKKK